MNNIGIVKYFLIKTDRFIIYIYKYSKFIFRFN